MKTDKEERTIFVYRDLVYLRSAFKYFNKNKEWILGGLFTFSIIKDCVWYACFGVNILAYSSLQDCFISLFNYVLIFIIVPLIFFVCSLMINSFAFRLQDKIKFILITVAFIIISFVYFFLFKKVISFLAVLVFFYIFLELLSKEKFLQLLALIFLFLSFLSLFSPVLVYMDVLNKKQRGTDLQFMISEDNMDFYSFTYNNKFYDTSCKQYYMVGNTTQYFYIFDSVADKTLIFPKDHCTNIKTEVFILSELSKK